MSVRVPAQPLGVNLCREGLCSKNAMGRHQNFGILDDSYMWPPKVMEEGLYIICWVILNVSGKDLSKHLIFLETYRLYLQVGFCPHCGDGFHQQAGSLGHPCRNFVPVFARPTVPPSMLFPLHKPSKEGKKIFFLCKLLKKSWEIKLMATGKLFTSLRTFLFWLYKGLLSLIPIIPKHSQVKFEFGSSHTSVAFSLKLELWV